MRQLIAVLALFALALPAVAADADCPGDQVWIDGECQQGESQEAPYEPEPIVPTSSEDCPDDLVFIDGECQQDRPLSDEDCPDDRVLVNGKCQTPSSVCPGDQVRQDGECVSPESKGSTIIRAPFIVRLPFVAIPL